MAPKGQLISEELWYPRILPKNKQNNLITVLLGKKMNSFIHFLEESSAWKNHYDFVWPLVFPEFFLPILFRIYLVFGTDFKAKMPHKFWTRIVNFDHSVYSLAKWKEIDISTLAVPFSLERGLEGAREPRLCQSLMALKQELYIKLIILDTFHGQTCIFC